MARTAELADITRHDTFAAGVPHDTFRWLRSNEPVSWWEEDDGSGFWAVTRYDDLLKVSKDHATFTSSRGIRLEEMAPDELEARRTLMEMDPPQHTELRRMVNRLFTRGAVQDYEETIRDLTVGILDRVLPSGEFDFVDEVARELPMRMLGRLMGVPDADGDWLVRMGDQMIGNTDPEFTDHVVDQTDTEEYRLLPFRSPAAVELFDYANELARERRRNLGDDLISRMLSPTREGRPLSDLEFKNFFVLMVAAGNDTTRYSIVHSLQALIDHPEAMNELRRDLSLLPTAVEEFLRWASTTMHFRRTVTMDTQLGGRQMSAGDKVLIWYISANYDEDQFPDPYTFDITRDPNDHVTFGRNSPHLCIGAWLARLEMRVVFEELLPRIEQVEPAGPVERLRSNFINGVKHMPVRVRLARHV